MNIRKRQVRLCGLACLALLLGACVLVLAERIAYHAPPAGMALIPGDDFEMGDALSDGWDDEAPTHTVCISAFYMDSTEITNALWDEVATWAALNGYDIRPKGTADVLSMHPATMVSWYDAVKWANARSEMQGLTPCYTVEGEVYRRGESEPECYCSSDGYRLPTEAEWEMAARGGENGHRFPWGDCETIQHSRANYFSASFAYDTSLTSGYHPQYVTPAHLCTRPSWYNSDSGGGGHFYDLAYTSPVGSFAPNGYGLYDMAGNVWEWCWDWYFFDYYARSPATDPTGPSVGSYRVLRGGSWYQCASRARVAARGNFWPSVQYLDIGLRLVRIAS